MAFRLLRSGYPRDSSPRSVCQEQDEDSSLHACHAGMPPLTSPKPFDHIQEASTVNPPENRCSTFACMEWKMLFPVYSCRRTCPRGEIVTPETGPACPGTVNGTNMLLKRR